MDGFQSSDDGFYQCSLRDGFNSWLSTQLTLTGTYVNGGEGGTVFEINPYSILLLIVGVIRLYMQWSRNLRYHYFILLLCSPISFTNTNTRVERICVHVVVEIEFMYHIHV